MIFLQVTEVLADKMAGQRAFGIADAILRQLLPAAGAPVAAGSAAKTDNIAAPLNKSV